MQNRESALVSLLLTAALFLSLFPLLCVAAPAGVGGKGPSVALPSGVTIELLGVREFRYEGGDRADQSGWWGSGGNQETPAPYAFIHFHLGGLPRSKYDLYEVAFRINGLPGERVYYDWRSGGTAEGKPVKNGKHLSDVVPFLLAVPKTQGATQASFALGIGSGPWETYATYDGNGCLVQSRHGFKGRDGMGQREVVTFRIDKTIPSLSTLIVEDDLQEREYRVVAVAADGRREVFTSSQPAMVDEVRPGPRSRGFRFQKIAPAEIERYDLQVRGYEYLRVQNVSLAPGQRTEPKISALDSSPFPPTPAKVVRYPNRQLACGAFAVPLGRGQAKKLAPIFDDLKEIEPGIAAASELKDASAVLANLEDLMQKIRQLRTNLKYSEAEGPIGFVVRDLERAKDSLRQGQFPEAMKSATSLRSGIVALENLARATIELGH